MLKRNVSFSWASDLHSAITADRVYTTPRHDLMLFYYHSIILLANMQAGGDCRFSNAYWAIFNRECFIY